MNILKNIQNKRFRTQNIENGFQGTVFNKKLIVRLHVLLQTLAIVFV
jgi:hypothetical protein